MADITQTPVQLSAAAGDEVTYLSAIENFYANEVTVVRLAPNTTIKGRLLNGHLYYPTHIQKTFEIIDDGLGTVRENVIAKNTWTDGVYTSKDLIIQWTEYLQDCLYNQALDLVGDRLGPSRATEIAARVSMRAQFSAFCMVFDITGFIGADEADSLRYDCGEIICLIAAFGGEANRERVQAGLKEALCVCIGETVFDAPRVDPGVDSIEPLFGQATVAEDRTVIDIPECIWNTSRKMAALLQTKGLVAEINYPRSNEDEEWEIRLKVVSAGFGVKLWEFVSLGARSNPSRALEIVLNRAFCIIFSDYTAAAML
ncbi:hypothetical protein TWF718_003472 [Orbilia javanica]|uniref:Uncharacterized protein n=1 Tax=Orbilia javanica TaxID=47235 RepID=A0AAN8R925_9PEZI